MYSIFESEKGETVNNHSLKHIKTRISCLKERLAFIHKGRSSCSLSLFLNYLLFISLSPNHAIVLSERVFHLCSQTACILELPVHPTAKVRAASAASNEWFIRKSGAEAALWSMLVVPTLKSFNRSCGIHGDKTLFTRAFSSPRRHSTNPNCFQLKQQSGLFLIKLAASMWVEQQQDQQQTRSELCDGFRYVCVIVGCVNVCQGPVGYSVGLFYCSTTDPRLSDPPHSLTDTMMTSGADGRTSSFLPSNRSTVCVCV